MTSITIGLIKVSLTQEQGEWMVHVGDKYLCCRQESWQSAIRNTQAGWRTDRRVSLALKHIGQIMAACEYAATRERKATI